MAKDKDQIIELDGIVLDTLPDNNYKVKLDNGHIVNAYVSGKMRINYIRILPGDKVRLEMSICDLTHGRITYRY